MILFILGAFLKLVCSIRNFTSFKCHWNEFLDLLKFTTVKMCKAKNLSLITGTYIQPCNKYTYGKYCDSHAEQLPIACEEYHYTRGLRADDPELHYWARKELRARLVYCQRFAISTDYGHAKWHDHLRGIIDRYEQTISWREDFARQRKQQRLDRVQNELVCSQELTEIGMSLESVKEYKSTKKSADNDAVDDDWSFQYRVKVSESVCENQLKKININKHLFQTYYNRSSLDNVQHLNLILRTKKKLILDDGDDW